MAAILYPLFTLANLVILPWLVVLCLQTHCLEMTLLMLIMVAITYDNAVISLGKLMGQGKVLLWLSQPRFFLHVTLTPLTILAALCQGQRAGMSWTYSPWAWVSIWMISLGLVFLDLITYYRDFNPVPIFFQGTLRYSNASAMVPPIPAIVTVVVIGVIGALMWVQVSWPWLFLSALVTFVGSAVPPRFVGPLLSSGTEIVLMVGFGVTEAHLQMAALA